MPKIATNKQKKLGAITKIEPIASNESYILLAPDTLTARSINKKQRTLQHIVKTIVKYTTQTPTYILFQRFKLGAMVFFLGLVVIYGAYQLLDHSLLQEVIFLIGLALIGSGFLLAMLAQVRMLLSRLIHIFFHK